MYKVFYDVAGAFFRVWHRHFNLPLGQKQQAVAAGSSSKNEAAAMVACGWLMGIVIALLALGVSAIFNRFCGALVYALLAYGLLLNRDRGCGDGIVAQMISAKLPCDYIPFNVIIPIVAVIFKVALLMLIFLYGRAWYLGMIIAGALAMEASLAGQMRVSPPLIDWGDGAKKRFWLTAAAVLILSFITARLATACGALAFALLWKYAGALTEARGITLYGIKGYSAICIWLMLSAGILTI